MSVENIFVLSNGEKIPVIIENRRGVRNVTLRPKIEPTREIHISKPWLTSNVFVLKFLESKRKWIERVFDNAPIKEKIKPNTVIEILGRPVKIIQDSAMHGNCYMDAEKTILCIGGGVDMFERRARDFIKQELLNEIKNIIKTVPREYWPTRITLRDTTSRWGSCASNGHISFSWRLSFAPYEVMRYVVMHELSHRKYMDHSKEFWANVSLLYGFGVERAKRWLSKNGQSLHRYF